jgi:hypothetical protein
MYLRNSDSPIFMARHLNLIQRTRGLEGFGEEIKRFQIFETMKRNLILL